jgi:hypothetical protein
MVRPTFEATIRTAMGIRWKTETDESGFEQCELFENNPPTLLIVKGGMGWFVQIIYTAS